MLFEDKLLYSDNPHLIVILFNTRLMVSMIMQLYIWKSRVIEGLNCRVDQFWAE